MSKIYVLRHANWDLSLNKIDPQSLFSARSVSVKLPEFAQVISSPAERATTTAALLTGTQPTIDDRASTFEATNEQGRTIADLIKTRQLSPVEAIFSMPELAGVLVEIGAQLVELCREILANQADDQNILVVSHDTTMASALKILKNEDFTTVNNSFAEFEGFTLDENLNIKPVSFI